MALQHGTEGRPEDGAVRQHSGHGRHPRSPGQLPATTWVGAPPGARCEPCDTPMIPTTVEGPLTVRLRGDSLRAYHSTTRLEAYTCPHCGRTDFFAAKPLRINGPDWAPPSERRMGDREPVRGASGSANNDSVHSCSLQIHVQ